MKKYLTWICMIACIFGLTACGSEEVLTSREQKMISEARDHAVEDVLPMLAGYANGENSISLDELTATEIQYIVWEDAARAGIVMNTDGYAFLNAVESFRSAMDSIGEIKQTGETTAEIDGNQIIVEVEIIGEKKNATAEVIFSNDMFYVLESASLNPVSTVGELMGNAALNTLIGMGTVFVILILISAIISCFKLIPVIQDKMKGSRQKAVVETKETDSGKAVVKAPVQAESAEDDLELAAVIAAAIAAYEGAGSADGYVVRSIRRRR